MNQEDFESIKVLWRQPSTLALWGIPYRMREGQQPYDLWKAHRDYVAPRPGWYGSKRIDISDWIWLGNPGWYGHMSHEDIRKVQEFLVTVSEFIPGGPFEWAEVTMKKHPIQAIFEAANFDARPYSGRGMGGRGCGPFAGQN